ncbi:MAG: GNAT family N-acetyltransferase [Sarcina sp.]
MECKSEEYKRSGSLVYIKKPNYNELDYTKELWADYETMKEVGGVYDFTDGHKNTFYKKMINPTDGKNFYCLVYKNNGEKVGEVSFHGYDCANKMARLNVKIHAKYRGNGYGTEAAKLLLEYYFYEFLGEVIIDRVTNKIAEKTLQKLGFTQIRQGYFSLKKNEFTQIKNINKMEVGIVAFNGVSFSRFGIITELLKECEIAKFGNFNIDIISKYEFVKSNTGIEFKVDQIVSSRKKYDMIIFLDGVDITKENENIKKYFKNIINSSNNVIAIDDSISILLELEYLKGMNVILTTKDKKKYNDKIWNYTYVDASYVDNGKFMLLKGIKGTLEGSLHLISKLYGKENKEKIKLKI